MVARTLAIAGLVTSLFIFSACGSSDDSSTTSGDSGNDTASAGGALDGATIYNNQYTEEIQYFRDKTEGMEDRAKELGATVESEYGNVTPEVVVEQVENALTRKPDAISIVPMDEASLLPVLRQAKEQGIPTFVTGAKVEDLSLVDAFLGAENDKIGEEKAQYVVDKLNGKGTVGIIRGIKGQSFSTEQGEGYEAVLSAAPGITVVDGGYAGGYASDLGLERTENLLTRSPDIDAIIYDADDLTLGGIQAIKQRGIANDDIVITSTDGGAEALKKIQSGQIDLTVSLCGFAQGIQLLDLMDKALAGETLPDEIISKWQGYSTENIEELLKKPRSFCS